MKFRNLWVAVCVGLLAGILFAHGTAGAANETLLLSIGSAPQGGTATATIAIANIADIESFSLVLSFASGTVLTLKSPTWFARGDYFPSALLSGEELNDARSPVAGRVYLTGFRASGASGAVGSVSFAVSSQAANGDQQVLSLSGEFFSRSDKTVKQFLAASTTFTVGTSVAQYTVNASAPGGHGTIACTPGTVSHGGSTTCTMTPDTGYAIASITDNSSPVSIVNPYVISNVTADHTVVVTFTPATHTVTPQAGPNGSISPSTPQTISHGSTTSFTVTATTGYAVASVTGCSGSFSTSTGIYTTGAITGACTVTASFTAVPPPHTISTSVIKGQGTITCTPSPVPHGQSTTCTITPDDGYSLIALTDNGVPVDIAQLPTNARTLLVSSDRAAWSEIPSPLSHPVGLAAKKDRVILAGADGMARSPDGITWTGVDQDISLTTVYADATRFLAATSDGKILISPDGITWEAVVDVPVPLVRITGGKGTYVAVGAKGTILTSPDGITWTTQNAPTGASLTGIVYGNGTFLAMTENSMLLTSYDGIVWTSHDAPAPGLSSLAYEKGVFTVTAADGRSFRSSTAVNWTSSDDRIPPASPYILTNITPVPAGYGAIGILTNGILSTGYTIPSVTTDHTLTVSFARDLTNAEFITQQYRDFLNRDPDEQGLSAWVGVLTSGQMTRAQVVESFLTSSEFGGVIAPLVRLYFAYFLRVPDYEGLLYWIGQRQVGLPLNDISSAFASSQEFIDTYGSLSPDAFITLVYHNVLGRDPDPSGFSYWLDELTSNRMTRGQIMAGFSESPEYQALMGHEVLSTMMYVGLLRRSPEPGGFTAWVGYLDAGNPATAMIDGFLGSAEYRGRF